MLIPGARAHDYGTDTPAGLFCRIAADGWQTVQLAPKKAIRGVAQHGVTDALVAEMKTALNATGLAVGVLGAYVEPSLADDDARKAQVDAFCRLVPVAAALSAGCIGTETTSMDKQPGTSRAQALACLRRSLQTMLAAAEQHGVPVAVEPVFYHAMATPEDVRELLRDMQSPHLKVIFDPVNLLAPELVETQEALWERAFACFGEHIAAVHIKGARREGGRMVSCPLEESVVDYQSLFARLRQLEGNIPVLREEAVPARAKEDLAFIRALNTKGSGKK